MSLADREYARLHRMDPEPPRHAPRRRFGAIVIVLVFLVLFVLFSWPTPIFKGMPSWGHLLHSVIARMQSAIHSYSSPYEAAEKKVLRM
jgi:hypothetical protein